MSIFDRALARAESRKPLRGKGFSMPPFWSVDGSKVALDLATLGPYQESAGAGFEDYVQSVYKKNGIVFACIMARARVFSQARFLYQQMIEGRPGNLFGSTDLRIVERPWDNGTTGALLTIAEIDASVSGNFFATVCDTEGNIGGSANRNDPEAFIARLRPDWSTLIIASPDEDPYSPAARVVGLSYKTPGAGEPLLLTRREFMHYAPLPDPVARWKGMSWLSSILRDAQADSAYTTHTLAFLKNGATPNLVVSLPDDIDPKEFQKFVKKFKTEYEGASNAYRTLFVAGGADVRPVSAEFQQLDIKGSQGKLETRIAAAAGVHPSITGLSEGLTGSSLNSGNFGAARRLLVDSTIRDLWSKFASSVEVLVPYRSMSVVAGSTSSRSVRMWYDARDIPFLREDAGDEAKTFYTQVQAARHLVDGGWEADAAIDAAAAADIRLLKGKHTGMLSVQLRPPGAEDTSRTAMGIDSVPTLNSINGNGRATTSASR